MTYGIQCFNTSGEMTLSSEAYTFSYLGKATLVSVTHYSGSSFSSTCGYAVWTFNSPGPIVVALGMNGSLRGAVTGISKSGASTWNITVVDFATATEGISPAIYGVPRSDSNVYVFGLPTAATGYGAALYNASGVLTADLTKKLLSPAARIYMDGSTLSLSSLPTLTVPAIIGPAALAQVSPVANGSRWDNFTYRGLWHWASGTLTRQTALQTYSNNAAPFSSSSTIYPIHAILIEANGLT